MKNISGILGMILSNTLRRFTYRWKEVWRLGHRIRRPQAIEHLIGTLPTLFRTIARLIRNEMLAQVQLDHSHEISFRDFCDNLTERWQAYISDADPGPKPDSTVTSEHGAPHSLARK
ncbi:hypothetical protein Adt_35119 [Abeliophyllum distichum]|uniref:Uncharacterized protein n=1 Tax=Abeliophyllum distichum TaxID=126358 RepID=A0ABD1QFM0_9LAMI